MVIYLSTVTYIMVLRSIAAAQMKFSLLMNLFDIPLNMVAVFVVQLWMPLKPLRNFYMMDCFIKCS